MSRHNDMQRIADGLTRLEGGSSEYTGTASPNPQQMAARSLIRKTLLFACASTLANGTTAITPTNSPVQEYMEFPGRVLGVRFNPAGAAAADVTNNAQISLKKGDGTVMATIATTTTGAGGTGSLVAGTSVIVPKSATEANTRFAKGDILAPAIGQNASGVATPAGTLQVTVEMEGPIDNFAV